MADVSVKLGEYMLKGWVLTDEICTKCRKTPMMRSPSAHKTIVSFCAACDGNPSGVNSATDVPEPSHSSAKAPGALVVHTSSPSISSSSRVSRSSTPPTEVSSTLSSPIFAPPAETEQSIRRRQQSDIASAEIGKRLLKGWAMLAEECPNSQCYSVPLVRPPKPGGGKDPKKVCVICGNAYVFEVDAGGWERLVPIDNNSTSNTSSSTMPTQTNPLRENQELMPSLSLPALAPSSVHASPQSGFARVMRDVPHPDATVVVPTIPLPPQNSRSPQFGSLDTSAQSLELALKTLSTRLMALSSNPAVIDATTIGTVADAIGRVTQALSQVRQLQWSESQAHQL